jgi:hypothetical protein
MQSACETDLLDQGCTMDQASQWGTLHFRPRPLFVLLGDSITQYGNDVGWGGQLGKSGPGWASAIQVLHCLSTLGVFYIPSEPMMCLSYRVKKKLNPNLILPSEAFCIHVIRVVHAKCRN